MTALRDTNVTIPRSPTDTGSMIEEFGQIQTEWPPAEESDEPTTNMAVPTIRVRVDELLHARGQTRRHLRRMLALRIKNGKIRTGAIINRLIAERGKGGFTEALDVLSLSGSAGVAFAIAELHSPKKSPTSDDYRYVLIRSIARAASHSFALSVIRRFALHSLSVSDREAAAEALGDLGGQIAASTLLAMSNDDSSALVRTAAAESHEDCAL